MLKLGGGKAVTEYIDEEHFQYIGEKIWKFKEKKKWVKK